MTHYELLQIPSNADDDTIRKAAIAQAVVWNRRAQGATDPEKRYEAERTVRQLKEAKLTLLDPQKRLAYDAALPLVPSSDGYSTPELITSTPTADAYTTTDDSASLPGQPGVASTSSPRNWTQLSRRGPSQWWILGVAIVLLVTLTLLQSEFHRLVGMACYGMAEDNRLRADLPGRRVWLQRAKAEFYVATLLNPRAAEPLYNLAVVHFDLGELAYARAELSKVISLAGTRDSILREKAQKLLKLTEFSKNHAPATSKAPKIVMPARAVTTLSGTGLPGFVNGPGNQARFQHPRGVAAGLNGAVLVADRDNHAIRYVSPGGSVVTLAGAPTRGYANGRGTAARFNAPRGVVVSKNGTVYVADTDNHCVRKITPEGQVTTFVGAPEQGFADGLGSAARFCYPFGLALDKAENLFVADTVNQRIRRVSPSGEVTTIAGSGTAGFQDGTVQMASFKEPCAVATDEAGNVFVVDSGNHRIRKIDLSGNVSTVAGSGKEGFADGPSASAAFSAPLGIAIATNGLLYVADTYNRRIRVIASDGTVSTVAGAGVKGFHDDHGLRAKFSGPISLAIGPEGTIYVADWGNHRIRKVAL